MSEAINRNGLTLPMLADAKKLPEEFLTSLGILQISYLRAPAVRITYRNPEGEETAVRFRIGMDGDRFRWRTGDKALIYGLDRLPAIREKGQILIVEGESDCWTAWLHDIRAVGIPGKGTWKPEWAEYFVGLDVYIWQEPGAEDFSERIGSSIPSARIIVAPPGMKDISEAHIQGSDVPSLVHDLMTQAVAFEDIQRLRRETAAAEVRGKADDAFASEDPLTLIEEALRESGLGGDTRPGQIVYLAATSRVLRQRRGSMPAHLLVIGPTSAGKSYTVQTVLSQLPPSAFHVIDAASPGVLIYDEEPLAHRVVVFGEADSLPAGEDNPAASAIRNLAQDGHLHYKVTVKDRASGEYRVRNIQKPGPTVLITTAVTSTGGPAHESLLRA